MEEIKKFVFDLKLLGDYSIELIDPRYIIIKFSLEADYIRLFSQRFHCINGLPMSMLKWFTHFDCSMEPFVTPIWIFFPRLHLHYFNQFISFSWASIFRKPILVDVAKACFVRQLCDYSISGIGCNCSFS